jgi:hypothetical protein
MFKKTCSGNLALRRYRLLLVLLGRLPGNGQHVLDLLNERLRRRGRRKEFTPTVRLEAGPLDVQLEHLDLKLGQRLVALLRLGKLRLASVGDTKYI